MKPREFQEFAERCYQAIPSEASSRSAISRAYYAALHKAERCAIGQNIPEVAGESRPHQKMIKRFALVPGSQSYVEDLYNLKVLREAADYKLNDHAVQRKRDKALLLARSILDWIDDQQH